MKRHGIFLAAILLALGLAGIAFLMRPRPLPPTAGEADGTAGGEVFGKPVSEEEVAYHLKTAALFSRSGDSDRSEAQMRQEAWQNLILLKEADHLGIQVDRLELEEQLKQLLSEKGVEYGTLAYEVWVKTTLREDVKTFERRLENLLRINVLMRQKLKPEVTVTEEEIRQKFLNQYNNFESEYIVFESKAAAGAFLEKAKKDRALWGKTFSKKKAERARRGPPGAISCP